MISGEARGEPYIGQVAVGGVILNRVRDERFPIQFMVFVFSPGPLMPLGMDNTMLILLKMPLELLEMP